MAVSAKKRLSSPQFDPRELSFVERVTPALVVSENPYIN
jgi:hypothetical protein